MNPENQKIASLYVLVFPERGFIKIGKANNVHERGRFLKTSWGAIDYPMSYELKAPTSMVLKLEKSLHFLLSNYRADVNDGDGYTELFNSECLDVAVMHLDLFASSGVSHSTLKKGIDVPESLQQQKIIKAADVDLKGANASAAIGHIGTMAWSVYSVIKELHDWRKCGPSVSVIAGIIGVGTETIGRAIDKLQQFNMIKVVRKNGKLNEYVF